MRSPYRILAYLICLLVALQAAYFAWAMAGLETYLSGGGTIYGSDSELPNFPEAVGLTLHGMSGVVVIPLVAVALLVISFFTKVPGAVAKAGTVLGLVVLQVALGMFGHELSAIALLHGVNALALFAASFVAARAMSVAHVTEVEEPLPALV